MTKYWVIAEPWCWGGLFGCVVTWLVAVFAAPHFAVAASAHATAIVFVVAMFIGETWYRVSRNRMLRIARQDLCANCGYSLTGLPAGARCPECGKAAAPIGPKP